MCLETLGERGSADELNARNALCRPFFPHRDDVMLLAWFGTDCNARMPQTQQHENINLQILLSKYPECYYKRCLLYACICV